MHVTTVRGHRYENLMGKNFCTQKFPELRYRNGTAKFIQRKLLWTAIYPRNLSPTKFRSYTVYIPKKDDYDKENAQEDVADVAPHVVEGSE